MITCNYENCVEDAATSWSGVFVSAVFLLFTFKYPQLDYSNSFKQHASTLRKLTAYYVDLLLFAIIAGPLLTFIVLLYLGFETGTFEWSQHRVTDGVGGSTIMIISLILTVGGLVAFFKRHKSMRRYTYGELLLGIHYPWKRFSSNSEGGG